MIIVTRPEQVRPWKVATLVFALASVAAGGWGISQARRVHALEQQADSSRTELAQAKEAVRQAEKRELPVSVSYSGAASEADGLVAVLKSDFPRSLEIVAMCSSPRTSQRKRFNLTIPAKGQIQIGQAEGWTVTPGSRIMLYNNAFRPAEYVVPEL
jgi:hypothetical protein